MTLGVGMLGAGAISPPYYAAVAAWPQLDLISCTSQSMASAERRAGQFGIAAVPFEAMLADPAIDVIVNLTPVQAHFETSRRILLAGKHLYSEKPLAATLTEARILLALADERGLRIGCAPDTFFGAAHQAARAEVDSGRIGTVTGGSLFLASRGPDNWHPFPEPFYRKGGGPLADHGPYHLTQLVNLIGPIASVVAHGIAPEAARTLSSPARKGETIPVEVLTSAHAILAFESGASVTLTMSWDVWNHARKPIEIYGSEGSLLDPDPNWSDGEVLVSERGGPWQSVDHSHRLFHAPTMITFQGDAVAYYRLSGLADMADAIAQCRPHRASGELAAHVLEVIEAIGVAAETGRAVAIGSRVPRPAPIADDIDSAAGYRPFGEGLLDARTLF